MTRVFWVALGATAGVVAVRRAERAARRLTPEGVAEQVSGSLGSLGAAVRTFGEDLRDAMADREDELRTGLGLDRAATDRTATDRTATDRTPGVVARDVPAAAPPAVRPPPRHALGKGG